MLMLRTADTGHHLDGLHNVEGICEKRLGLKRVS